MKQESRVALVTGAAKKLGAAIARNLATRGCDIVVNDLCPEKDTEKAAAAVRAAGQDAIVLTGDVTNEKECLRMMEAVRDIYGRLDVLVNNVGTWANTGLLELQPGCWDSVMSSNVKATYLMSKSAFGLLRETGGTIVNICASAAFLCDEAVYAIAKSGIRKATEILAVECAPCVRVNALAPGLINDGTAPAEMVERELACNLTKKLARYEDMAEVVGLMAEPAFRFMTGHTIVMDGGKSIPLASER